MYCTLQKRIVKNTEKEDYVFLKPRMIFSSKIMSGSIPQHYIGRENTLSPTIDLEQLYYSNTN